MSICGVCITQSHFTCIIFNNTLSESEKEVLLTSYFTDYVIHAQRD